MTYDPSDGLLAKTFPSLILASSSPNRREYLESLSIKVIQQPVLTDEKKKGNAEELTETNAKRKMDAFLKEYGKPEMDAISLDTLVSVDGKAIGKPKDRKDAENIIRMLSGRTHQVYTSLFLYDWREQTVKGGTDRTDVTFFSLSDEEIDKYIEKGEWEGAAGGYRIQKSGMDLIERIDGDWTNVIGIPVTLLLKLRRV